MAKTLIQLIRTYQKVFRVCLLPSCRFSPSCSDYAILALQKHGSAKGLLLALKRLLRCHPLSKGGVDLP